MFMMKKPLKLGPFLQKITFLQKQLFSAKFAQKSFIRTDKNLNILIMLRQYLALSTAFGC